MANIQIWDGSTNFIAGESTPFGFYDDDLSFQEDAPKVARYCAEKLGWPVLDIELHERQFYAAFEEAVTAYGKEVIEAITAETISSQLGGGAAGSAVNQTIFRPSLQNVIATSAQYGTEAGVGGPVTLRTAMIDLVANQQDYDLTSLIGQGPVEIRKVFYEAPPAIMRYFDPYAGTGTGIQSLMDAFDFGSFSPGVNFLLMPASYDVLKTQAIEFNDQIRKSTYSFEIHNNILTLFPVPARAGKLKVQYYILSEKTDQYISDSISFAATANSSGAVTGTGASSSTTGITTNISNANAQNLVYSEINAIGRQWIFKYAAATSKEILAYVRGKYETVPVPGSEVRLNAADLLADARTEKATLVESLKATMQTASLTNQLQLQATQTQYINDALDKVPMLIYVG
ncbi:putative head completion protein [Flavobacterium phage vB_FspM_immuto_3-5A]|jgi:hypothetical protein|uniref:Putative head completion protein n=1 Tax=Flavobacterium phage vB_FspM_immuto_2-6A TaxID=2801477 RepID=A0A7T8ES41_9CAUD|nr:putative head completion protein [Flavobacterium phage vB_FspM_immuto_2-6A]QQO91889.1 putative head completion protein [Flavobacterium phage vB_FspM_immuto_2-6A]QQO92127.1 putative head completion protein [Flavobacterium phage vB_FspM_immuto_3-5A]QQO92365.1 putative head completion protein [Flavobacterium phage vB_FspM_immuto_13-6C]